MEIVSVREKPEKVEEFIEYFQKCWSNNKTAIIYRDAISHSIEGKGNLSQWYLLMNKEEVIGCVSLLPNDFISRMELYPWLCALYIEESHRGHRYSRLLVERVKGDAQKFGFVSVYLATNHNGFYEKYGFQLIGEGYHPWGERSKVYEAKLS